MEKYVGVCAYADCLCNPVKHVDFDGQDITSAIAETVVLLFL